MPLTDGWIEAALAITGDFETIGDPWVAVSGDFDGMGISCGPLQWNIGQNSFQPMVRGAGQAVVMAAMPQFGAGMWSACNSTVAAGLAIVRRWQQGTRLLPQARTEIAALLATPEMHREMLAKVGKVATQAYALAVQWDGQDPPSGQGFCWFFDLVTQNGGLKGLGREDVTALVAAHGQQRADDVVCDWLEDRPGASGHDRDAHRNAEAWRNAAQGPTLDLLLLSYLRALLSLQQWRHVVLNRKGCIAMGHGWVNGEHYDLRERFPQ